MIRVNVKECLNNLTEGCDVSHYAMVGNDLIQACFETNYRSVTLTWALNGLMEKPKCKFQSNAKVLLTQLDQVEQCIG